MASAVSAQAPIRCSQLSSTISTSWAARASSTVSRTGPRGCAASRSAWEMAGATASPSFTAASSTSQTPSPEPSSSAAATRRLNLVLPHPPAPVRVTSREDSTRARTCEISCSRPINADSWAGRLFCRAVAAPSLAASTSAAAVRPRAAATNSSRSGPVSLSAPASSSAVSLRAVRLMPRSRSLTDRGDRLAASASSSCVSPASPRSCRSRPAKLSASCSATGPSPPSPGRRPLLAGDGRPWCGQDWSKPINREGTCHDLRAPPPAGR